MKKIFILIIAVIILLTFTTTAIASNNEADGDLYAIEEVEAVSLTEEDSAFSEESVVSVVDTAPEDENLAQTYYQIFKEMNKFGEELSNEITTVNDALHKQGEQSYIELTENDLNKEISNDSSGNTGFLFRPTKSDDYQIHFKLVDGADIWSSLSITEDAQLAEISVYNENGLHNNYYMKEGYTYLFYFTNIESIIFTNNAVDILDFGKKIECNSIGAIYKYTALKSGTYGFEVEGSKYSFLEIYRDNMMDAIDYEKSTKGSLNLKKGRSCYVYAANSTFLSSFLTDGNKYVGIERLAIFDKMSWLDGPPEVRFCTIDTNKNKATVMAPLKKAWVVITLDSKSYDATVRLENSAGKEIKWRESEFLDYNRQQLSTRVLINNGTRKLTLTLIPASGEKDKIIYALWINPRPIKP